MNFIPFFQKAPQPNPDKNKSPDKIKLTQAEQDKIAEEAHKILKARIAHNWQVIMTKEANAAEKEAVENDRRLVQAGDFVVVGKGDGEDDPEDDDVKWIDAGWALIDVEQR